MCSHVKIKPRELERLNTRKNAAIAYRGMVYDVTGYLDKHPAGSDKLLLVAGKDVTGLATTERVLEVSFLTNASLSANWTGQTSQYTWKKTHFMTL